MNRYEKLEKERDLKGQMCVALMHVACELTVRQSCETDGLKCQEQSSRDVARNARGDCGLSVKNQQS